MLSVLIVDDEPAAIDAMVQIVNWEEINLSVCARAYNGKEGLEKFRELLPDIVLTDVRMPLMDGIEMSRQIKAESPDTMIILVSGYNEFEYVQSALQFGAIEYLLKPTDPDKLHQVLCKAAGQISRKKMWEQEYERMKKLAADMKPVGRNQFFNDLITYRMKEDEIWERVEYYEIHLERKPYYLVKFLADRLEAADGEYGNLEIIRQYQHFMILEQFQAIGEIEVFLNHGIWYAILQDVDDVEVLENASQQLSAEYAETMGAVLHIALSAQHHLLEDAGQAKEECEVAAQYLLANTGETFALYDGIAAIPIEYSQIEYRSLESLYLKLHLMLEEEAITALEKMFRELERRNAVYALYQSICIQVLLELYSMASQFHKCELEKKILQRLAEINQSDSCSLLCEKMKNIIAQALAEFKTESDKSSSRAVKDAIEYAEEHLGEKISLQEVADYVNLSKNYFCNLFKKEKKETFVNYLTRMRMNKAKYYLKNSDFKVFEIAELVGYEDYIYFAQMFKKAVGISAGEYRAVYRELVSEL